MRSINGRMWDTLVVASIDGRLLLAPNHRLGLMVQTGDELPSAERIQFTFLLVSLLLMEGCSSLVQIGSSLPFFKAAAHHWLLASPLKQRSL